MLNTSSPEGQLAADVWYSGHTRERESSQVGTQNQ